MRALGLLGALMLAVLSPHVHAADPPRESAAHCAGFDHGADGEDNGGTAHCGFCHVARGILPDAVVPLPPCIITCRLRPAEAARLEPLPPDVPARPPRPGHIA